MHNASLHMKQLRGEVLIRLGGKTWCSMEREATTWQGWTEEAKKTRASGGYGATVHACFGGADGCKGMNWTCIMWGGVGYMKKERMEYVNMTVMTDEQTVDSSKKVPCETTHQRWHRLRTETSW